MDRQGMLKTVQDAYAARVRGDVDGVVSRFAGDASFRINAAPTQKLLAHFTEDADALRNSMKQLIDNFAFSDLEIVDSVVEGSKMVVRVRFTVTAKATGNSARMETLDLIEFEDGKIASFTQFADTAAANALMSRQGFSGAGAIAH